MPPRTKDILIYVAAMILTVIIVFYSYSGFAAEPTREDNRVMYKKKTSIDFSDKTIEGELTKPTGSYLGVRKNVRFKNFIKVRTNFRSELMMSEDNL